jgi:hypothetical protein
MFSLNLRNNLPGCKNLTKNKTLGVIPNPQIFSVLIEHSYNYICFISHQIDYTKRN